MKALAATSSSSTTTKTKRKKEKKKEERGDTVYDTQSEDEESLGRRRRVWKSKHKNVIDPVFLGELEHLMQDLASCQLEHKISPDLWPDR